MTRILAFVIATLAFAASASACPRDLCLNHGTYSIIDGDTLRRDGAPNIRLWGIDAPEQGEAGGPVATGALEAITTGANLLCNIVDVDRFGRIVAQCFHEAGFDLACVMVAGGWAVDWPRYSQGYYQACQP